MHQKALCSSSSWILPKVQKGPGMLRHSTQTGEGSLLGIRWCLRGATMILLEFWLKWEQCKGPTSFLKSIWSTLYPKRFLTMLHHWIPRLYAAVSLGKWQVKLSHLMQNCARLQSCCHCPWVLKFTHMPPLFTRQLAWAPAEALASPAGTGMGRRRSSNILRGTVICFRKVENIICSLYLTYVIVTTVGRFFSVFINKAVGTFLPLPKVNFYFHVACARTWKGPNVVGVPHDVSCESFCLCHTI